MISPCQPDDAEAIESLASRIWREVYPGIIPVEQIEFMLGWMYSPEKIRDDMAFGVRYFWIEHGSERAGFAAFGPDRNDPGIWLHKLYVDPAFQRKGLGSSTLADIEPMVFSSADQWLLRVNRHNEAAVAAYRKNGFDIIEERCSDIGGGFVMDDYIMAKPCRAN